MTADASPSDVLERVAAEIRAWLRLRRDLDTARAVRQMLNTGGQCLAHRRKHIDADPALAAFFSSVADADAWREEIDRVRIRQARNARHRRPDPLPGAPGLSLAVIVALLPTWRAWGQMVLDAEASAEARKPSHGDDQRRQVPARQVTV